MISTGIHAITEEEYQAEPCERPALSSSIAKIIIAETPLHAWAAHPRLNPNFVRDEKEIFDRGSIAHELLLQGISKAHIIQARNKDGETVSNWQTKAAKQERAEARAAGLVPILQCHWDAVQRMVERAREQLAAHKEARNAFTAGKPEQTLVWEDDHGVICRARLDWLHDSHLIIDDYKSTGRDVNPETIAGRIINDWEIQEAFYRRGVKKLTGKEATFRFIAQENTEPYALSVIAFGPDIQWMGDSKVQRAIDLWAQCMKSGIWPGYPDRICYPSLPKWAEEAEERRQLAATL